MVHNIYKGFQVKPIVLGPGGFFDPNPNWFTEFVAKTPNSLQVVTHHIYNLGPGTFHNPKALLMCILQHFIRKSLEKQKQKTETKTLPKAFDMKGFGGSRV